MKKLYVRPAQRGCGLGRELTEAVVAAARRLDYRRMVLDMLDRTRRAQALYEALGFRDVVPYYANPLDGVPYMAADLRPAASFGPTGRA